MPKSKMQANFMPLNGDIIIRKKNPSQVLFIRQGERTRSNSPQMNESTEKRKVEKAAIINKKKRMELLMSAATKQANKTSMSRQSSRVSVRPQDIFV